MKILTFRSVYDPNQLLNVAGLPKAPYIILLKIENSQIYGLNFSVLFSTSSRCWHSTQIGLLDLAKIRQLRNFFSFLNYINHHDVFEF